LASLLKGERRSVSLLHAWPIIGKARWFQLNAARFECWGKTYVVVVNEDVTAVKDARRASEEMAERLRTLQEEERQRIAKELHDSTAQHLVAVGLNVMRLKSRLGHRRQHAALFKEIEVSVQEASKELRTFTYLLHPPKLDSDGFRDTAERYALGFGRRAGLSVSIRIASVSDDAPFEVQRCLFRVIQEALTNIYRHALASKVRIELRHLHRQLHLIVRDNGVGIEFPDSADRRAVRLSTGVGIPGMQERLRYLGGELAVRSGSGGTRVHAIVPFDAPLRKSNGQRLGTELRVRLSTVNGKPRGILPHQA
jgi:signal transduction histidine kinase